MHRRSQTLGSHSYAEGNGIILRELSEPGAAFDIFYEQLWLPGIERQAQLIARIKSQGDITEENRVQAILLISSIVSFHTRRRVAQRAIGWSSFGPEELATIVRVLHEQVDRF